ncbi:Transmembrane amino acid transporter family protein [Euphorbia peplus]|nr:Transmembrane amino acid transporter family protein [Euphorbia peplus]
MENDQTLRSFSDIARRAFRDNGIIIINIITYVELYLVATGFVIVEGDNLHDLFPNVHIKIAGLSLTGTKTFIMISTLIILPSIWLDYLSALSCVSGTGVLASIVIRGCILWVGAFDGMRFEEKGQLIIWDGGTHLLYIYLLYRPSQKQTWFKLWR